MLVNAADPSVMIVLTSVGIVNRDCECLYKAFIRPPVDCRINPCLKSNEKYSLKKLALGLLGEHVQVGGIKEHNALEDAKTMMKLPIG